MYFKVRNKKHGDSGIYVGRGTILGNRFKMETEIDREHVIEEYKKWLWKELQKKEEVFYELMKIYKLYKKEKNGINLTCYCTPKLCHADVIVRAIRLKTKGCEENRVSVVGSRTFDNYDLLKKNLDKIKKITNILSGGAKGADSLSIRYAKENPRIKGHSQIPYVEFKSDWDRYGKIAGYIRNKDIILNSDMVIAFWDGKSKGTQDSIKLAKFYKIPVEIVKF